MKKISSLLVVCTLMLLYSCGNGEGNSNRESITIAVAANMQYTMEQLVADFEKNNPVDCEIVVGSSGKLTAQIKEGAPYDIFVSADMKYPQELYNSGNATAAPEIYALGTLVLWTAKEHLEPSLNVLTSDNIEHIAIANPDNAPYGVAAEEILYNQNLYDFVKDKLVFGESVSQTNQFITSLSADIGFTAKSVVLSEEMKSVGRWIELPLDQYSPINQGVVILKREEASKDAVELFYNYLFSEEARSILKSNGYDLPAPKF